jgi:hypothetical protein
MANVLPSCSNCQQNREFSSDTQSHVYFYVAAACSHGIVRFTSSCVRWKSHHHTRLLWTAWWPGNSQADIFKVCPATFLNLYTIPFELVPGINWDAVNPDPACYSKTTLTRFWISRLNSVQSVYSNSVVLGCYFNLYRSVLRKVQVKWL